MSKIDELISELCPEGVALKAISEYTLQGQNVDWSKINEPTQYIDLSAVDRVSGSIRETQAITVHTAPSRAQRLVEAGDVIFATTRPTQMRLAMIPVSCHGHVASTGFCILRAEVERLLPSFLAHYLKTPRFAKYVKANQVEGNYPSIPDSRVRSFEIPVPPLEVQREIVSILDKFTQLEAELEAELEAREKQLESVRSAILFASKSGLSPLVELAEVCRLENATRSGEENSPYVGVEDLISDKKGVKKSYKEWRIGPSKFFKKGDVLLGNIRPYLRKIWQADEAGETNGDVLVVRALELGRDSISPDFLYQVLASEEYFHHLVGHSKGAKMPRGDKSTALKFQFPLPSLDRQKLVASSLGALSALTQNVSIGLPAEIAARRKQYEYYRDKLLTFKELGAE